MVEIIDIHTHSGDCRVFDLNVDFKQLFNEEKRNGVTKMIVQPFPGASDPIKVHNEIARLSKEFPGEIYGIVSLNPHLFERDAWISEVERLVRDEGFVGIKLHTIGHAINPLSNDGKMVFDTANRLGVPIMVHTGPGIPFALPSLIIPRAKQYPNLPIILAHAGWGVYVIEALTAALQCDNIYLEPSHVGTIDKSDILRNLSADRILFGSDLPVNIATELNQFRTLVSETKTLDKILGDNARRLFRL